MGTIRWRRAGCGALAGLCLAGTAWAAYTSFYWKPDGDDALWNNCANWDAVGQFSTQCYPYNCNDKVAIGAIGSPLIVDVADLPPNDDRFNDLVIQEVTTFRSANGFVSYEFNTLEIQSGTNGTTATITASGNDAFILNTTACPG